MGSEGNGWLKISTKISLLQGWFCFAALRPKSTAMVMAGRSVHLTTLIQGWQLILYIYVIYD